MPTNNDVAAQMASVQTVPSPDQHAVSPWLAPRPWLTQYQMADGLGIFRARNAEGGMLTTPCPSLWPSQLCLMVCRAVKVPSAGWHALSVPVRLKQEGIKLRTHDTVSLCSAAHEGEAQGVSCLKVTCLTALITSLWSQWIASSDACSVYCHMYSAGTSFALAVETKSVLVCERCTITVPRGRWYEHQCMRCERTLRGPPLNLLDL